MDILTLVAESSCPTCRGALFLQRLDGGIFCHGCGALAPQPGDFAQKVVGAALALGRGLSAGATGATSVAGFQLRVRRGAAACPGCGAPWTAPCEHCAACGLPARARRVASAVVVGEAPPPGPPAAALTVEDLRCRQCGAGVPLEGMPTSVACAYCGAANHVPPSFYFRGHMPTERKLSLWPDAPLEQRSPELPTALLSAVPTSWPGWPCFPQPDGSAVLVAAPDHGAERGAVFCVGPSLTLRWARHGVTPRSFTGPGGVERSFVSGPGVLGWVTGNKLNILNTGTGEDLPAVAFPEAWRELFRHPSVLLAAGPMYVKAGGVWRWDGRAFAKTEAPSLQGAHHLQSGGGEIWVTRTNSRGVKLSRLAWDLTELGHATAAPMPDDAKWDLAFAGESACALVVGKGVSLSVGAAGKLSQVFRLPRGTAARLVAFGAEGFTFLSGGRLQRFALSGELVFDGATKRDAG